MPGGVVEEELVQEDSILCFNEFIISDQRLKGGKLGKGLNMRICSSHERQGQERSNLYSRKLATS